MKWLLTRFGYTLGLPGLIAFFLALGLLVYLPLIRWPAQQRLEILSTASMQQGSHHSAHAETGASVFLKQMPQPESLSQELQTIFDTAEGYGLLLDEVTYSRVLKQDERLQRYHVDFAINAPYPIVRIFLAEIMAAIPSAALEQLALTRDEVQSGDVKARVRLTLFLVR